MKNGAEIPDLKTRTKSFALRIIRVYSALPKSAESQIIGRQLLRSGTSVGAHYREACRARSTGRIHQQGGRRPARTRRDGVLAGVVGRERNCLFEATGRPEGGSQRTDCSARRLRSKRQKKTTDMKDEWEEFNDFILHPSAFILPKCPNCPKSKPWSAESAPCWKGGP
jgi:hypothetical protein